MKLMVTHALDLTWAILLEHDRPLRLWVLTPSSGVGNVYLAKVVRALPNLSGAFVAIGRERTGWLSFQDSKTKLSAGERVMVQLTKSELGSKGAQVSTDIRLRNGALTYRPLSTIKPTKSHHALHLAIDEYLQAHGNDDDKFSTDEIKTAHDVLSCCIIKPLVVRSPQALIKSLLSLDAKWQDIISKKTQRREPTCLYEPSVFESLGELVGQSVKVHTPIQDSFDELKKMGFDVVLDDAWGFDGVFYAVLAQAIDDVLATKIILPSGGYLVIDRCEAMTVIDVNSGACLDPVLTNLEAIDAICHHIRLSGMGGMVTVDFINTTPQEFLTLSKKLSHELKSLSSKSNVHRIEALSLAVITAPKNNIAIEDILTQPCPDCHGVARYLSLEAQVISLAGKILHQSSRNPSASVISISTSVELADFLSNQHDEFLSQLSTLVSKEILLNAIGAGCGGVHKNLPKLIFS